MNLLLVEDRELTGATCIVTDRRAAHLREVLGVVPGSTVKMGVLGGDLGTGEVISDDGAAIALQFTATGAPPPQLDVELVLAIPRPKALARVVETCAAFAVRRVELTNAWRVDKSYLRSPKLEATALAHAARLGAEQGATTHLPELHVHDRLMVLLDARFPPRAPSGQLLIAHPYAKPIETVIESAPRVLAIGPEGGWIERELATFVER
ncbi:MAG: RsmE family RNA methyltransferase, partial [Kofleriaceae bacterium]